jgi:hypothetical protein
MQQLALCFDEPSIEAPKPSRIPLYTYRVTGIVQSNMWFVFRHRIIPARGRKKAEIVPDWYGDNIEGRFETKEEAIVLRDKLEEATKL